MKLFLILAVAVAGVIAIVRAQQCSVNQFTCGDGECIYADWKCDRYTDCDDGSDEVDCLCFDNEVKCHNGQCIISNYWCDGIFLDCYDGSDEDSCATPTLPTRLGIQRTGLDKLTREGKLDKVKYQQKLKSLRNNNVRKSAMS